MKNHVVFKFVALILCAACLLGAVGSGLGIFALTAMDLYDKSVDQVYHEQVDAIGQNFADELAMEFTSKTMGGFSDAMMESVLGTPSGYYRHHFEPGYYGYVLKDYEGTVLESQELNYPEGAVTYVYDITGQYMYLVDVITQEEPAPETEPADRYLDAPYDVLINDIPPEGAILSRIQISFPDSSSGASGDQLGTVFRNQDGRVILRCPGWDLGVTGSQLVTAIALYDRQEKLIYEASAAEGVGMATYSEDGTGDMVFTSFLSQEDPADAALPAETEVPVTTAPEETIPETTAPEETVPEEPAEDASVAAAEQSKEEDKSDDTDKPKEEAKSDSEDKSKDEEKSNKDSKSRDEEKSDQDDKSKDEDKSDEDEKSKDEDKSDEDEKSKDEEKSDKEEKPKDEEKSDKEEKPKDEETSVEAVAVTEAPTEPAVVETVPAETIMIEPIPEETQSLMINGKNVKDYQINRTEYYDPQLGEIATAKYVYVPMPAMAVELQVAPGALRYEFGYTLLRSVQAVRGYLLPALGIFLLLFAVLTVYLCYTAGRNPKNDELRAGYLNRMPIDGYFLLAGFGIIGLIAVIGEGGEYLLRQNITVGVTAVTAAGYLACLLFEGFWFAFAAQIKTPGHFWWHNSLCGRSIKLCGWLFRKLLALGVLLEQWLAAKGLPRFRKLCKWVWGIVAMVWRWFRNTVNRCYLWLYNGFSHFYDLLPMTWQWILAGSVMILFLFITVAGRYDFGIILAVLFAFALVFYGARCFGSLQEATRKMNKGDLTAKANDKRMIGAFRDFAHDLNDLADVVNVAAQKQLKSERMKTELITNVSHDIKTPLTSIINYVDLLQKPHTEEEGREYLEVLDRQSQQLKKLIEDLMVMSKANTGNMTVDITQVDAVESVNQALGEFTDKLDQVQITPVFRHTEDSAPMLADGRLVWRVLNNLLSNAVKYAMPGTRLYIDLMSLEGQVVISLKNISRDELNVDAEELMERFVRGDDSRNTEGSGLGLNIAKSLMELQKGQLQLLVDGDLFKVTLIFPGA